MDSERTCKRCGDQVDYLSTDNLCDGCGAEQEAAEAERDLRLREFHAEAVKDPGYQEALEAARGPVSASKGMFLEDALRERARQSIAEGEQAVADEVPLTTIEDVVDAAAVSEWKARDAAGQLGRRLSVNVALDVAAAIEELAASHGITITEVVRRAISAYKYLDDERALGRKILMERHGTVWEVTFT